MSELKEQRPKLASAALEFDQSEDKAVKRYDIAVEAAKKNLQDDRKRALEKLQKIISDSYGDNPKEVLATPAESTKEAPLEADNSSSMDVEVTTE